jgi:hypothetical protein
MESGKYGGSERWLLMNPPSGNSKPMGISLLGHPVIPPRYGQVDKYKIQAPVRNKKNQMHIFKGFEDQSDTYHDTLDSLPHGERPTSAIGPGQGDGCCCC